MTQGGDPQTLPFTYDRSDFAALSRLARPPIVGWLFKLVWVLLALLLIIIGLAAVLGDPVHPRWIAATLAIAVFAFALNRFGSDLAGWIQLQVARRSGLLREQRMTVTPTVFRAESSRGMTETNWPAVPRIEVEDGRLFVFIAKRVAFIVPRRAFESDMDFDGFVAAAKACWKKRHSL